MTKGSLDPSYTQICRANKAISDESWIKKFLMKAPVGVLATVFEDQPFLSTKLFVYNEARHAIYLHSADKGRVYLNVGINPKVCFTAYDMGRFLPAERSREFGVEFESVVVFGQIEIVQNQQEVIEVLEELMVKYAPHLKLGVDYARIQEDELHGMALYRLEILGWSAKQDEGDPNHPGAYRYDQVSR